MNVTVLNQTVLTPGETAYLPVELYVVFLLLSFGFFFHSIIAKNARFSSIISTMMFLVMAALTWSIEFHGVATQLVGDGDIYVLPYSYVVQPPYIAVLLAGFFFASMINSFYVWFRQTQEIADAIPPGDRRYR